MTEQQRTAIRDVCSKLIYHALAYAYARDKSSQPVYSASRGFSEIEQILERNNA